MFDVLLELIFLILPAVAGYLLNVFRKRIRNGSFKKILRFDFPEPEQPSIHFVTANTGHYDGEEMVTLGYIFEYMSVGEIKACFSKLYSPYPSMTTNMSPEHFESVKLKDLKQNLVLIGGPFHNRITGALLARMVNCPFHYDSDATLVYTSPEGKEDRFTPLAYDPDGVSGEKPYFESDYCLIMNIKNPWDSSKRVILISGCRSVGCYGGAVYLSSRLSELRKKDLADEYALVIQCDGEREDLVSPPQLAACYPLSTQYKA